MPGQTNMDRIAAAAREHANTTAHIDRLVRRMRAATTMNKSTSSIGAIRVRM
jgi:hypothetical protein